MACPKWVFDLIVLISFMSGIETHTTMFPTRTFMIGFRSLMGFVRVAEGPRFVDTLHQHLVGSSLSHHCMVLDSANYDRVR